MLAASGKQKVCLLDFDGVVLRNPVIHHNVKKRVVKYVSNVIKTKDVSMADHLNQYLYESYGHTMIGMHKVFGKDVAGSLGDFNHFVYDNLVIKRCDFFESRKDVYDWNVFIEEMRNHDIPVYIFSNAPKEWCVNFLGEKNNLDFIYDYIPYDVDHLKPRASVFERVSSMFPDRKIYFIDDKLGNFVHTIKMERWVNLYFKDVNSVMKYADQICCV